MRSALREERLKGVCRDFFPKLGLLSYSLLPCNKLLLKKDRGELNSTRFNHENLQFMFYYFKVKSSC